MEAVSGTIEMESYLQPKPSGIAQVEPEHTAESVIAAIQHQQTVLLGALHKVVERLENWKPKHRQEIPPSRAKRKFQPETSNCMSNVLSGRALYSRMCIPIATL